MARQQITISLATVLVFGAFAALVLNAMFGPLAALTFMACAGLLMASNITQSLDSIMRWWFVLLLPAYCMLTALWSLYPANSLRYGVQLAFTLVFAIVMTGRLSTRTLMRLMFAVYGVGVLASIGFGRTGTGGAWLGVFGSKNAFAAHMAVFLLVAAAVAADRNSPLWLRLGGLVGALASGPLLVLAQSAGAMLMMAPCLAILLLTLLIDRLTGTQRLFLATMIVLGVAALGLFVLVAGDALLAEILEGSGKDPTLTGRTDLWALGLSYIAERPLQGLGYRSFWVVGFGPAEQLWAMFGVPSGAGFNFHNTYISNAVEIGLIHHVWGRHPEGHLHLCPAQCCQCAAAIAAGADDPAQLHRGGGVLRIFHPFDHGRCDVDLCLPGPYRLAARSGRAPAKPPRRAVEPCQITHPASSISARRPTSAPKLCAGRCNP